MAVTGKHALAILTALITELVTSDIKSQLDTVYNNMSVDQTIRYLSTPNEQIDHLIRKLAPHILDTRSCRQLFTNEKLPVRLDFIGRFEIVCDHLNEIANHSGEIPSDISKLFMALMIKGYYSHKKLFPLE